MKKIILCMLLISTGIILHARTVTEREVPVLVKYAFYQDYPEAYHVKWEITKLHDYKASFRINNDYGNSYYNEKGEFIESDITIQWTEVPFTGRMELYHLNKAGHITSVLKIVNNKQEIFYLVGLKRGLKLYEILLDKDGNLMI